MLRIRNTLIRIRLFTLMRIRILSFTLILIGIRPFTLMRIRLFTLTCGSGSWSKWCKSATTGIQTLHASIVSIHDPPGLHFEPSWICSGAGSGFSLWSGSGSSFLKWRRMGSELWDRWMFLSIQCTRRYRVCTNTVYLAQCRYRNISGELVIFHVTILGKQQ